jgi:16S rRNA (cytidine1402-2'-O)-methyltransferase
MKRSRSTPAVDPAGDQDGAPAETHAAETHAVETHAAEANLAERGAAETARPGTENAPGDELLQVTTRLTPLEPGLYLVACPIGNLADVTLRALAVLARADLIACEDTRYTRRLLQAYHLDRSDRTLLAYHEHNAQRVRPKLMQALKRGDSVALVSDAGTPLVSDPGYKLVREAVEAGVRAVPIPGASAVLAGLTVAGLPTDRFCFAGFPPPKSAARTRWLEELARIPATLVLFEAPQRLAASLADMTAVFGPERPAAVARELTKLFEEVRRDTLGALAEAYGAEDPPRGELVVLLGPPGQAAASAEDLDALLRTALGGGRSLKDAVKAAQDATGLPRKRVYARALELEAAPPPDAEGANDPDDAD